MKILFYGLLADAIGRRIELDASDGYSVADLRLRLVASHPQAAAALGRSRACVGSALVADDHAIAADGEVEFLPPVSGG